MMGDDFTLPVEALLVLLCALLLDVVGMAIPDWIETGFEAGMLQDA